MRKQKKKFHKGIPGRTTECHQNLKIGAVSRSLREGGGKHHQDIWEGEREGGGGKALSGGVLKGWGGSFREGRDGCAWPNGGISWETGHAEEGVWERKVPFRRGSYGEKVAPYQNPDNLTAEGIGTYLLRREIGKKEKEYGLQGLSTVYRRGMSSKRRGGGKEKSYGSLYPCWRGAYEHASTESVSHGGETGRERGLREDWELGESITVTRTFVGGKVAPSIGEC